jgi:hypothetical protein
MSCGVCLSKKRCNGKEQIAFLFSVVSEASVGTGKKRKQKKKTLVSQRGVLPGGVPPGFLFKLTLLFRICHGKNFYLSTF